MRSKRRVTKAIIACFLSIAMVLITANLPVFTTVVQAETPACTGEHDFTIIVDETYHKCSACDTQEAHDTAGDGGICSKCGYFEDHSMDGFPLSFGTGTLEVDNRDRVDMDNFIDDEMFATGGFSVAALPEGLTFEQLFSQYNTINFNAKIVGNDEGCKVEEISYSFSVEVPVDDHMEICAVEIIQGYPTPIDLPVGENVTFQADLNTCFLFDAIHVNTPPGMGLTYNDIKDAPISMIMCNFKLDKKGVVTYVAPNAKEFRIDKTKPYLNIVIPEMEVIGDYNGWGSWGQVKALYNANENKGTGFTTYKDLLQNYKGIKIKVEISNINPKFNKDNEIFFYLHDPEDGMMPGTVDNDVKYDITDAHKNRQYIRKNGGVQEFTFDFEDVYYMEGSSAPDIWLSMAVESRPEEGNDIFGIHYCDIKPVIENENGIISLGEGCEKMQFTDASNSANGGLMDVEKATKISLNVSNEASVLTSLEGTATPSNSKQAQLKTLINKDDNIGTDASAKEQVKQVMEINLSVDGTEIQPKNNKVNVSIPVSKFDVKDTSKMKLYHHTGDKLVEISGVEVKDGKISFDTPSFSYFVVVEESNLTESEKQINKFVTRMYSVTMNRTPDQGGLEYWSAGLKSGEMNGASLAIGFVYSKEFQDKKLSDAEYVDALYTSFFDRSADAEGKAFWVDLLAKGADREKVLAGFVNSKEFGDLCDDCGIARGTMDEDGSNIYNSNVRNFVLRNYEKALGRKGEMEGVEYWSYKINKGETAPIDVVNDFFHSKEFIARNLDDAAYVDTLYATYFGRTCASEERAYWVGRLKDGATRDQILNEFAYTEEFAKILESFGLK